jgi:hypothetical protein
MSVSEEKNEINKLLRRYYSKEMSDSERHALESRALDDPFLYEAMEGFDHEPTAIKFKPNQKRITYFKIIIPALCVLSIVILTIFQLKKPEKKSVHTSPVTTEIDHLSPEEDTLKLEPLSELIQSEMIIKDRIEIEKKIENDTVIIPEKIIIPEQVKTIDDYEITEWKPNSPKRKETPHTYLFDLYVVDYREITRPTENIKYLRYDLGGVSADKEDANEVTASELIESIVEVPYFEYLKQSMSLFSENRFKLALKRYSVILEQYPEDLNVLFYGGLCLANLGRHESSITYFDKVLSSNFHSFEEEAKWYKVKSLLKLNRYIEAKENLLEIISEGGFYAKEAVLLEKSIRN